MSGYVRRVLDTELDALMPGVAAIAIRGARAVGKTATATERARTTFQLDRPGVHAAISADPEIITRAVPPVLVDEWQLAPETWDVVRRAADSDRTGGRFLLTGSASPLNPPTHSGAGRIVSLHMRPMTLAERGLTAPSVSLARLLEGDRPALDGESTVSIEHYAHEIVTSGFPGLRGLSDRVIRAQLDGYLEQVVDRDLVDLGGLAVRRGAGLRRWLVAYASAVSSTTAYERIRDAATAGHGEKPARTTVLQWLDALERLFLVEPVPAWSPTRNDLTRTARSPKHQLIDPALAARLRGATIETLLAGAEGGPLVRDPSMLGALFESLVTLDVRVHGQAAEGRVSHFRDQNGDHEVDLIVERADRRIVAIEVKLTRSVSDADVRHLRWLRERLGVELLDAVVISTGPYAYRRPDGIGVIPAALLGP